jgi:folate-dependent phosphoribosylglycinamide formyltransferase PurN
MSDETNQRGGAKDIRASLSAARETVRETGIAVHLVLSGLDRS